MKAKDSMERLKQIETLMAWEKIRNNIKKNISPITGLETPIPTISEMKGEDIHA